MKELMTPTFIARDGTRFTTAAECKAYELDNLPKLVAEATAAEIKAAFAREDLEMADLIEQAGDRIRRDRLAAGDRKRRKNGEAAASGGSIEAAVEPAPWALALKKEGAAAARAGYGATPPADLTAEESPWWLAGWHEINGEPARQTEAVA